MSFGDELITAWSDPPAIYRGAPFWSWNSKLDPDRLCRAIESMHQAGMGGFFMHSRYGLKTPYLSEEWFRCVSACVEKARELDMKAYLYDEDRWPSGAAGGLVTRDRPELSLHFLVRSDDAPDAVARFAVEFDADQRCASYERLADDAAPPADRKVVAFAVRPTATKGAHNDAPYSDNMNPNAVAEFLRTTHDAYAERYGEDFGGLVPAIFTDEPNYGISAFQLGAAGTQLPWTPGIVDEFRARRGYDLADHLPALALPLADGEFSRVRHDYLRTCCELFVESFSAQIGAWCEQHNIALTGHMLMEEKLSIQAHVVGACMPHYEHMQWPGIDMLRDQANELVTAKQCSSVADQLGRARVLSEMYGCTGWDWPLAGHKAVGDWQYACGVNFRCPHLTHYSLAGGAKRDYPASIFAHSPWWKYYHEVEAYFGRLGVMLTQGRPVRDVLVIHPIESVWGVFGEPAAGRIEVAFDELAYALTGSHLDWDLGDESLLVKYAEIDGERLRVGRMDYGVVVVPPSLTLRSSTVAMLERFVDAGGKVLVAGDPPTRMDGELDAPDLGRLVGKCESCGERREELVPAVEKLAGRRLSIRRAGASGAAEASEAAEAKNVWAMVRSIEGGQLMFCQSHDREEAADVRIRLRGGGPVVLWDCRTGERFGIDASADGESVAFDLHLPPAGSALITAGVDVPDAADPPAEMRTVETRPIEGAYEIALDEDNTLPLDYCRMRIGEDEFSEPMPVLQADETIRARYGMESRIGKAAQPWYLYAMGTVDTAERDPVELRWHFHVTDLPPRCRLALESPDDYDITVNGRAAGQPDGWWVDEDIRTVDITGLLAPGDNEIVLGFRYRPDMELEDLYLVGDFGVGRLDDSAPPAPGNHTLTARPERLDVGSWVSQGLDFYGGAVRYRLRVQRPADLGERRVRLRLPGVSCTAAAVHVGEQTIVLPWRPWVVDLTDALADGENEVAVEVIGGRKNILGPLHTPPKAWTGPLEFDPNDRNWRFEYYLTDHGLTAPPELEIVEPAS